MRKTKLIIIFSFLIFIFFATASRFGSKFAIFLVLAPLFFLFLLLKPQFSIYIFLFIGIFFTPLYDYRFRLFGILILPSDLMAILIFLLVLLNQGLWRYRKLNSMSLNLRKLRIEGKLYYAILYLILLATFLGLIQGNYWKSVFRETKLALYYGLIPVFATYLISKSKNIQMYFIVLILLATVGSIYDLYCRVFDIYTVSAFAGGREGVITYAETPIGRIIRDYGWVSTFDYQVIAFLACLIFFFSTKNLLYRILLFVVGLINLIANLLTVTRGFTLAILMGIIFLIFLRGLGQSVSIFSAIRSLVASFAVIIIIFYVSLNFVPEIKASFYRFSSIFLPGYAGKGDIENMQFRLSSIYFGLSTGFKYPLGKGFGILSPTGEEAFSEILTLSLLYHNSIGYIYFTFGIIGGTLIFYLLTKLFLKLIKLFKFSPKEDKHNLSLILVSLVAVFSMSFTSGNVLFTINGTLPFIVTIFSFSLFYQVKNSKKGG